MKYRAISLLLVCTILISLSSSILCLSVWADEEQNVQQTVSETQSDTEPDNEPDTEPETEPETKPETEPETAPETEPTVLSGSCGSGVVWAIDLVSYVLTISGSGEMAKLPNDVWSEYKNKITAIVVCSGVTALGEEAFSYASKVTSVSLPSTLRSVGKKAFNGVSSLRSISIPNSVTNIGQSAFSNCSALTSFTMPDSVTTIGAEVFNSCRNLQSVTLSKKLTSIPYDSFYNCSLLYSVTVPASVREVQNRAFGKMNSITFLGDAPTFSGSAFSGVDGTVYYPAGNITWTDAVMKDYGGTITWIPSGGTDVTLSGTFGKSAVFSWEIKGTTLYITGDGYMAWDDGNYPPWYPYRGNITKVVMTGNMTDIYSNAFNGCTRLTEVVWPSGLQILFSHCFLGCTSLKSIRIPNTVQTIEQGAFGSCTALQSITLSSSTNSIGMYAFSKCKSLQTINIPASVRKILAGAFQDCTGLKTVYFSGNMPSMTAKQYYTGTFDGISGLKLYYPAGNSSWTAANIKTQENFYKGAIQFLPNGGQAPEESETEPGTTLPEAETTQPEGAITSPSGETIEQSSDVQNPTQSQLQPDDGTVHTQPETQQADPLQEENSGIPGDIQNSNHASPSGGQQGQKPKSNFAIWLAGFAVAGVLATGVVVWVLKRKKA